MTFMVLAAGALWPSESHAALKCQELVNNRYCTDNGPRHLTIGPGQATMVPPPHLAGYSAPCWNWNRQFQCVETDPILSCQSGNNFNTVKNQCSLTAASIRATLTINSFTYITDAEYTYRCAFGEYTTTDRLPEDKECVMLDSNVHDIGHAPSAPPGTTPGTGSGSGASTAPLDT